MIPDIDNKEIKIGDEVILRDEFRLYRVMLVKETDRSVGYIVRGCAHDFVDRKVIFWIRKSSNNFKNMYKI